MSDLHEEPPDEIDQLDLAVETIEDLDADDADQQVRGGGTTGTGCP